MDVSHTDLNNSGLFIQSFGARDLPNVLILHGLLGSSDNWVPVAKALQNKFHCILPDLRNHGRSIHKSPHTYPEMAKDLFSVIDTDKPLSIIGHSMGGKAALPLVELLPEGAVNRLILVDIAPLSYPNQFQAIFSALKRLKLADVNSYSDIQKSLEAALMNRNLVMFLMKNISKQRTEFSWKSNITLLADSVEYLSENRGLSVPLSHPVHLIYGGLSDYITDESRSEILQWLPNTKFIKVPDAGHWVHQEQREQVITIINNIMDGIQD